MSPFASLSFFIHFAQRSALVGLLLSAGGLVFPRSDVSHSPKLISEACCSASFGDGGLSCSLISAVSNGLRAVWSASGGDLPIQGRGVVECTGRQGSCLPPLVVSTAADQFLLLTNEVVRDVSRQNFVRNVLHHLIRAPEALPTVRAKAAVSSESSGEILVQLQCALMMFEGFLASAAGARHGRSGDSGAAPRPFWVLLIPAVHAQGSTVQLFVESCPLPRTFFVLNGS